MTAQDIKKLSVFAAMLENLEMTGVVADIFSSIIQHAFDGEDVYYCHYDITPAVFDYFTSLGFELEQIKNEKTISIRW